VAVIRYVVLRGFGGVMLRVRVVAMRDVRVMGGLLVVSGFMMLGGGVVVLGSVLVMLRGFAVVLRGILRHVSSPYKVWVFPGFPGLVVQTSSGL
jgi:hypothetical protein